MTLIKEKVIGIVGGMGPQSGVALFNSILCETKAKTDQQHLSAVLMSFPKDITDRTLYLENDLITNPAYNIISIIKKLEAVGATVIGLACNTCHSPKIFDVISSALSSELKLLNMPFETCKYIQNYHKKVRRVGIMATNGTYKTGLYKDLLFQLGYEVVVPEFEFQNDVIHKMIYDPEIGIKSNAVITPEAELLSRRAISFFKAQHVDAIILGCTELSLIIKESEEDNILIIDSVTVLAKALIREVTN